MTQTHKAAAEEKAASAPKRRKKKKALPICVNLANCKYDVVRTVLKKLSWKEVGDDDHWHLYWTDTSVAIERVMRLSKTQKINHFTGKTEPKKSKLAHVASKVVATLNSNRAELARREAASAKAASGPAAPTREARSASAEQSVKEASSSYTTQWKCHTLCLECRVGFVQ